jgi:hypothetical protein
MSGVPEKPSRPPPPPQKRGVGAGHSPPPPPSPRARQGIRPPPPPIKKKKNNLPLQITIITGLLLLISSVVVGIVLLSLQLSYQRLETAPREVASGETPTSPNSEIKKPSTPNNSPTNQPVPPRPAESLTTQKPTSTVAQSKSPPTQSQTPPAKRQQSNSSTDQKNVSTTPSSPSLPSASSSQENNSDSSGALSKGDPLADLVARNRILTLPPHNLEGNKDEPQEIAKIGIDSSQQCELTLLGGDRVLGSSSRLELATTDGADGSRLWTVIIRGNQSLGSNIPVATFCIINHALMFQWKKEGQINSADLLRYCLLNIQTGSDKVCCFLNSPKLLESPKLSFLSPTSSISIPADRKEIPDLSALQVDLKIENYANYKITPSEAVKIGQTALIQFVDANGDVNADEPIVDLEAVLKADGKCVLTYQAFVHPTDKQSTSKSNPHKERITRNWLTKQVKTLKDQKARAAKDQKKYEMNVQMLSKKIEEYSRTHDKDAQLEKMKKNLDQAQNDVLKIEDDLEKISNAEELTQRVEQVVEALDEHATISFHIYMEIAGEKVTIVQAKSSASTSKLESLLKESNYYTSAITYYKNKNF